ncbi:peptidase M24 [Mycobacterium sp. MS1601]|uniref:M24 family metallopeptidase n=1 Tax=Mycobacterium sp. MS1601 TaxID=1936029 RepID=UPI0009795DB6|nr:Xaa-Pro peptidase family protein [Mycobacterium sp. MS1601]AQA01900.1 peptidase M24 [Mycobacterium sp. MS1601]
MTPVYRAQADAMMLRQLIADTYADLDDETPRLPFTDAEYDARRRKLQLAAARADFDLVVISSPDGMCWLHGYQSRWYRAQSSTRWPAYQCVVLHVGSGELVVYDVEHHAYLLKRTSSAQDIRLTARDDGDAVLDFMVDDLRARGWLTGRVGLEMHSHVPNRATSERVQAAFEAGGCYVADVSAVSRAVRLIKSPAEIAMIERAAAVCDQGLRALQAEVRVGMTEKQAWGLMVSAMAVAGGEPSALHESVVVGPIELGHAYASDRVIGRGDVLCADPCGVVNRYHANIERWFVVGTEPTDELYRLAEIEAQAFEILCAGAADGVEVNDVTQDIEFHLRDSGLWGMHDWNGGYELGISFPPDWVGEWTFTVGESTDDVFRAGVVTNYESIVLYPMIDTIVFGDDGARTLSTLPLDVLRAG